MLPGRSKRYAVADGEIPRLVLTKLWQLVLIALLVVMLLVTIFPHKALVDTLYEQQEIDPLTLSYIQNLYRAETSNVDVALLLARSQGKTRNIQSLEPTLLRATEQGTPRQRHEAYSMLFESYSRGLNLSATESERVRLTRNLSALLKKASKDELPTETVHTFAIKAFELGLAQTGRDLLAKLNMLQPLQELEALGDQALAAGRYEGAASYFLLARDQAPSVAEARRLFRKGIEAYMAASLFKPAMQAADRHLGDLEADLPTLRFLSREAMAAGDPVRAAAFARRLVFTSNDGAAKP